MEPTDFLLMLVIGGVAGFLAGKIVKGSGQGLVTNVVVGILGAFVFGFLFGNFDLLKSPLLNSIAGSTLGAVILLAVVGMFQKER